VFIVDLAAQTTNFHVPVGRKPVAVAVNGDPTSASVGTAIVVNRDEDSVSIFAMPNTPFRITALSPSSVQAGNPAFTLTIQGTGFTNTSVVRFDGTNVPSLFVNSTQLTATIPAALVASARTVPVTVSVGSRTTASVQFTVSVAQNPAPSIRPPLRPSGVVAGAVSVDGFLSVAIDGDGYPMPYSFLPTSRISVNGVTVTSRFNSPTQLTAQIPGSMLQSSGTLHVTVTNPTPGGGASTVPFDVKPNVIPSGVTAATVNLYAPSVGIAVDSGIGIAVATIPGDFVSDPNNPSTDHRVVLLSNLTGVLPGSPPVPGIPFSVGQIPEFVAINPNTHVALVSNFGDNTVSLVDIVQGTAFKTIAVGAGPQGVAIDPIAIGVYRFGIGMVLNSLDGTATILDLNPSISNPVLATIDADSLGYPNNVAINPLTHLAVVTDASNDPGDLVPIDLSVPTNPTVLTRIPVGNFPTGVAIYRTRNLAVVANTCSGCGTGGTTFPTLSVVDLRAMQVIATIGTQTASIGQEPFGVDVQEWLGIAAFVTRVSSTLRFIDLKTPTPTLLSVTLNESFIPTGIAVVQGDLGSVRSLVTDVAGQKILVTDVSSDSLK
ncbi:MAG: IPT/TIG domain-containing protein, partial [candidate division NC10 bacterium]